MNPYTEAIREAKAGRRADVKSADSLGAKPKTVEIHATSRSLARERELASQSISEILERAGAMGFITEPEIKRKLWEFSSLLNRF